MQTQRTLSIQQMPKYKIMLLGNAFNDGALGLKSTIFNVFNPVNRIVGLGFDFAIRIKDDISFQISNQSMIERIEELTTAYFRSANAIAICVRNDKEFDKWYKKIKTSMEELKANGIKIIVISDDADLHIKAEEYKLPFIFLTAINEDTPDILLSQIKMNQPSINYLLSKQRPVAYFEINSFFRNTAVTSIIYEYAFPSTQAPIDKENAKKISLFQQQKKNHALYKVTVRQETQNPLLYVQNYIEMLKIQGGMTLDASKMLQLAQNIILNQAGKAVDRLIMNDIAKFLRATQSSEEKAEGIDFSYKDAEQDIKILEDAYRVGLTALKSTVVVSSPKLSG